MKSNNLLFVVVSFIIFKEVVWENLYISVDKKNKKTGYTTPTSNAGFLVLQQTKSFSFVQTICSNEHFTLKQHPSSKQTINHYYIACFLFALSIPIAGRNVLLCQF